MMNLSQFKELVIESCTIQGNTIEEIVQTVDELMVKNIKENPHNNWWKVAYHTEVMTETQCYNYVKAFREAIGIVYDVGYTLANREEYILVFTLTREMLGLEKGVLK